ncbi:SHOCT domain-containing protein [Streptomyces albogriseolus]|uniref:SHOCT domain-containing protein n=1 Tax=Streptomyces TaxID=1883 RepID=UPI0036F7CF90
MADRPPCDFAPSALLHGYQYRVGAEWPGGPGPSGPARRPVQRDAGGDARASATRPDLIPGPARPREATRDDVLVRPRCQRLGLVRDVGQHDPVLGADHYRRRPAVPGPGPHRRAPAHPHTHTPAGPSPEQLLAERFARGEIDEEEYQRRLTALHSSGPLTKH